MRILHFSDIHVDVSPALIPVRDWLGKRLIGGANHLLRRGRHFRRTRAKLEALARFAEEHAVDLAICTGDYTILGTDVELAAARELIDPLTKRPLGFVTVPGNHDVYLHDSVQEKRFDRYFKEFLSNDLPELAAPDGWPHVRFFGDEIATIAIRSARPNPEPWTSSGLVDREELRALERVVRDPRVRDRFVVVATHYALRRKDGSPDRFGHGLLNAEALLAALAPLERGCVLHGHIHERFVVTIPGLSLTVFGGGSATHDGHEGLWMIDVLEPHIVAMPGHFDGRDYRLEPEAQVVLHERAGR